MVYLMDKENIQILKTIVLKKPMLKELLRMVGQMESAFYRRIIRTVLENTMEMLILMMVDFTEVSI